MVRMNKEIKDRWLIALRSGDYIQGTGSLKIDDSFCCLGVLCDILQKDLNTYWDDDSFENTSDLLPEIVWKYAELPDSDPGIDGTRTLSSCNDFRRNSFEEIADLIEKHF